MCADISPNTTTAMARSLKTKLTHFKTRALSFEFVFTQIRVYFLE